MLKIKSARFPNVSRYTFSAAKLRFIFRGAFMLSGAVTYVVEAVATLTAIAQPSPALVASARAVVQGEAIACSVKGRPPNYRGRVCKIEKPPQQGSEQAGPQERARDGVWYSSRGHKLQVRGELCSATATTPAVNYWLRLLVMSGLGRKSDVYGNCRRCRTGKQCTIRS